MVVERGGVSIANQYKNGVIPLSGLSGTIISVVLNSDVFDIG